jgi:creatinine amidohydrolase
MNAKKGAITIYLHHYQDKGYGMEHSVWLEHLTWIEAEAVLTADAVVLIPLGAASKEHGPHLRLNNDLVLAEYLARRIAAQCAVVIAPPITYHFYPAFLEYSGSISLRLETARDVVIDTCRCLANYGPRQFYILNTGVSTVRALRPAAAALAEQGITLHFTDLLTLLAPIEKAIAEQVGGTHADEIETSMMLYIAPDRVDMRLAVSDYHPGSGPLTRIPGGTGAYSPSGIYGDATLATAHKGRIVVEALVAALIAEVEAVQRIAHNA